MTCPTCHHEHMSAFACGALVIGSEHDTDPHEWPFCPCSAYVPSEKTSGTERTGVPVDSATVAEHPSADATASHSAPQRVPEDCGSFTIADAPSDVIEIVGRQFVDRALNATPLIGPLTPEQVAELAEAEEACRCEFCGSYTFCGPPCCQASVDDAHAREAEATAIRRDQSRRRRLERRAMRRSELWSPSAAPYVAGMLGARGDER